MIKKKKRKKTKSEIRKELKKRNIDNYNYEEEIIRDLKRQNKEEIWE